MTGWWDGPRRLEDGLERLYGRFGAAGLYAATALVMVPAITLHAAAGAAAISGLYFDARPAECLELVGIAVALALAGAAVGAASVWRIYLSDLRWSRDPSAEEAAANWDNLARGTVIYVTRGTCGVVVAEIAWAVLVVADLHRPPWAVALVALAVTAGAAAFAPFAILIEDLIFRPRTKDVAAYLPVDFEPARRGLSSRAKAMLPVPGTLIYAGLLAGAATPRVRPHDRIAVALGVGAALAALAMWLFRIAGRSALDPIQRLLEATERVKRGDLSETVTILNNDELGDLTRSFNRMLAGLREREALRDHNLQLVDELRASRERIVTAAGAASRRIERDLHDGAQQRLVLLGLKLQALEALAAADPAAVPAAVAELAVEVAAALTDLRRLAHGIYPQSLAQEGLAAALPEAARNAALPVEVAIDDAGRYPQELEAAIYFCCLEALQNAAKHAGPGARAQIRLARHDGELCFDVSDDGAGFSTATVDGSTGLQNMRDRLGALGGELTISSTPGAGTTVTGVVPLGPGG